MHIDRPWKCWRKKENHQVLSFCLSESYNRGPITQPCREKLLIAFIQNTLGLMHPFLSTVFYVAGPLCLFCQGLNTEKKTLFCVSNGMLKTIRSSFIFLVFFVYYQSSLLCHAFRCIIEQNSLLICHGKKLGATVQFCLPSFSQWICSYLYM